MTKFSLKNIILKSEVLSVIQSITEITGNPILITDTHNETVYGDESLLNSNKIPIQYSELIFGWVYGREEASKVANLVAYLISKELDLKMLGYETLEKYRELALLYNLTEKLATQTSAFDIAKIAIAETKKVINTDNIIISLINQENYSHDILAVLEPARYPAWLFRNLETQDLKAEIINDFPYTPDEDIGDTKSIMYTPLKIKDTVIGVIITTSNKNLNYTSKDIKLLSAIAFQLAVAIENARLFDDLKETFINFANTLSEAIEKRDPYTGGHTKRVMDYSIAIGEEMKLSEYELDRLRLSAVMHDIGKIGINDYILLKTDKLNDDEWKIMKNHPIYGEQILSHLKQFNDIILGIKHHHERYDGKGYPDGLKGEEIDLNARIISVADSFDAMTSSRSYRKGMSDEIALEELRRNSGTQFDSNILNAFFECYKKLGRQGK